MKHPKIAANVAAIVFCVAVFVGCFVSYHPEQSKVVAHAVVAATTHTLTASPVLASKQSPIDSLLTSSWKQALAAKLPDGNVDIAVYDKSTGITAHYSNASGTFNSASVAKLSILEVLLLQNQQQNISGLTTDQLSEADPMIENSDDNAATNLWDSIGQGDALNAFYQEIGATGSISSDHWGLTQTTALDQLKVMNQVAYPGGLLSVASADQANEIMNCIESDQLWGVSAGVPPDVSIQLKDGWLDYDQGWNVNSVGHVHGDGQDYTIAVLTNNNSTEQDGINTVEALSNATWNALTANSKS
jgi:beta-lactamase class A